MEKTILLFIIVFAIIQASFAQIKITGKVTSSSDGAPLPGVNVLEKGTSHGVITDYDGKYMMDVQSDSSILVFTYIGFETQEIAISGQRLIDVILNESNVSLDEVVVIGYGTVKKMDVTGSITSVTAVPIAQAAKIEEAPKTWHRSSKEINAVKLLIGDDEDQEEVPLKGLEMKVQVDGFRARVLINYYFYNEAERSEGNFKIRLPAGASPYYFAFGPTVFLDQENREEDSFYEYFKGDSIYLNNDRISEIKKESWKQPKEAKVVPASTAAYAYSEISGAQKDPLLAEWAGADIFNCRVFPLQYRNMHRVVIGYDVNLTNIGLDKVFDVCIPKNNCTKLVDIDVAKMEGKETRFSYMAGLTENQGRYRLHLENPDMDEIEIRYSQPGPVLLLDQENKYFAASFKVDLPKKNTKDLSSDAVFMLDVSASSNPDKFNVWLKLMETILNQNRNTIKRFNVLFFNIESFWKNNDYIENTPEQVKELIDYCNTLSLVGASDIGAAISEACGPVWDQEKNGKNIFLLSDGSVSWGEDNLYAVSKDLGNFNRVFVYNTGISGTDLDMLEHLSRESGGALFSVTGEDEIKSAASAFLYEAWKIESIKMASCSDILIEGRPNYLFPGQEIVVSGRGIPKAGSPLGLVLSNGIKKQNLVINFDYKLNSPLVKRLYGQTAVNQLESFDYLTRENSIPYAIYFQVPGKTCSMLMLDSEENYKQFNIVMTEDSSLVQNSRVNELVQKAVSETKKTDGIEKEDFLKQLELLGQNDIVEFKLTDSLKNIIKNIPSAKFRVKPTKIIGKQHFKRELSDSALLELSKESPSYKWIAAEADSLEKKFGKADALKMLSTLIERNPGNADLARDIAYSALKMGMGENAYYLFRRVVKNRPDQPHAYHALAQILTDMKQYDLAMVFYEIAYSTRWDDRFEEFNLIAGMDYLRFLKLVFKGKYHVVNKEFAKMRMKSLESTLDFEALDLETDSVNLMIAINWNTDGTDIDLHVIEPNGEECYYEKTKTTNRGWISDDVTEGFGTEMYISPNIVKGTYRVKVKYFADDATRLSTKTKVYVVIYENWGKKNEKITRKVVQLRDEEELQDVMEIKID
jgi:tetratricopeptide (TPR) repeat protein